MKYSIDRNSSTGNIVVVTDAALIVGSCEEDQLNVVEAQLAGGKNVVEVLGTDDIKSIPYNKIQGLKHLSTDSDVDISYKQSKGVETTTLYFKDEKEAAEIVDHIGQSLPDSLEKRVSTQSPVSSVLMSVVSLLVCAGVCYLFFNKFRIAVYIIGGLWALFSLYNAYDRITNPPVVTRWNIKGKYVRKAWSGMKMAWSYAILGFLAFGISVQFPDRYGSKALYQSVYEEMIQAEDFEKFIARGADIDYEDADGDTALSWSLYFEDDDLSLALVEAGANVTRTDISLLEIALYNNAGEKVLAALMERGALEAAETYGFDVEEYVADYDDQMFNELYDKHQKILQAEQF